jgi:hypothetical protein
MVPPGARTRRRYISPTMASAFREIKRKPLSYLESVHGTTRGEEAVHFADHGERILRRHLVQHVGIVDEVERVRFQPAQILSISLENGCIEMNLFLSNEFDSKQLRSSALAYREGMH